MYQWFGKKAILHVRNYIPMFWCWLSTICGQVLFGVNLH